ncbi:MAG: single-stranded DNA-binding protein [Coriobacteriales bacterium]|jgi:single-strand DNA-binding protein
MSINKVIITGNLTRDPETRSTANGTTILRLGVAVNDRRRNQQTGDWEDYPNFVDCNMFGKRAEAIAPYLSKGTKVAIEGRLHYSSWEDRNTGAKRSKIDVTIDEIEFMSSRNSGRNGGNYGGGYSQNANPNAGYGANANANSGAYGSNANADTYGGNAGGGAYGSNANADTYGGNAGGGAYGSNANADTYGGNAGGYDAPARSDSVQEPPAPSPYDDEDIPF